MIVPIKHSDWQLLRYMIRAEVDGQKPLGHELRMTPTRYTKDGMFLDSLVQRGLIVVAAKPTSALPGGSESEKPEPAQFRARYRLTGIGRYAAEYGEFDMPYTPESKPLVGLAAEIFSSSTPRGGTNMLNVKKSTTKRRK